MNAPRLDGTLQSKSLTSFLKIISLSMNDKKKRMDYWVDYLPKVYYIEKIDR